MAVVKSELISRVSNKMLNLPYKDVEYGVNQILGCMTDALTSGGRIEIRGFGSFSLHYLPPRNAHNPRTREKVATIAKHRPHFKPGKELRDGVNASRGTVPLKDKDEES